MLRYTIEQYSKPFLTSYYVPFEDSLSLRGGHMIINNFLKDKPKDVKILEIGCGNGQVLERLINSGFTNVYGLTDSEEDIVILKERNIKHFKCDMHYIDTDEKFDIVFISHTLEHAVSPYIVLTEINRVLKNNGDLVIIVPEASYRWIFDPHHISVFHTTAYINLLAKTGFESFVEKPVDTFGFIHELIVAKKTGEWNIDYY